MTKIKIDSVDRKILSALQDNGRISNISLSEKAGISASPCLRRMRVLLENNIISKIVAYINPKFFGYNVSIFVSIQCEELESKDKQIIEESLSKLVNIQEIYEIYGDTQYLVKVIARNSYDVVSILEKQILIIPKISKVKMVSIKSIIKHSTKIPEL